jgi:phosphoribosylformylglycinamidine cyclo-ligase
MDYARFLIVGAIAFGAPIMIYAVAVDELLANAIEHTDGDGPVVELPASESAGSWLPVPGSRHPIRSTVVIVALLRARRPTSGMTEEPAPGDSGDDDEDEAGGGDRDGNESRNGNGSRDEGGGGDENRNGDEPKGLTYAAAGVDIDASEAATAALVGEAIEASETDGAGSDPEGDYAGLIDLGSTYLGLVTDGVGTKSLVAEAVGEYSTIGIDCIAMNVNDLVAAGIEPIAFVDYLAVAEPDEGVAAQIGAGLRVGAEESGIELVGGETAVMPEVVRRLDLAGACVGLASEDQLLPGRAEVGDALVGFRSGGIHSNGLTLGREAATREHDYDDPFPDDPEYSIGDVLLEPTRIYTHLLGPLREHGVHAAAHVTGGGWTNLARMGDRRYEITDPFDPQPVFAFVQRAGNVSDAEMYSTFNMGTGFVAALPPENAEALAGATDGRVIGRVETGSGVAVGGVELLP